MSSDAGYWDYKYFFVDYKSCVQLWNKNLYYFTDSWLHYTTDGKQNLYLMGCENGWAPIVVRTRGLKVKSSLIYVTSNMIFTPLETLSMSVWIRKTK